MIFYFAKVQDTEGNWHRKVGKTKDPSKRFSDKRLYLGWEYIATKQYNDEDIKEVEKQFKDLQIGRDHKNLKIPPHFMGKTEIIKKDVTDEVVIQRMEEIKIPTKTTLNDF
tara:strand:- start:554 stop:886 length:333 start_codon:yes stop_codon:yes gene_type:complete